VHTKAAVPRGILLGLWLPAPQSDHRSKRFGEQHGRRRAPACGTCKCVAHDHANHHGGRERKNGWEGG
jgi:hypothetical protein